MKEKLPRQIAVLTVCFAILSSAQASDVESQFRKLLALTKARLKVERAAARPVGGANSIAVVIDKRMELLSVIFRLAGNDEFKNDGLQAYAAYVDSRFGKFKEHPAVQFARKMRKERGVCCDAVVSLAIHLSDVPDLKVRARLENPALEQRWRPTEARVFAGLVRDFARESNVTGFLRESQPVYELAQLRMRRLVDEQIDQKWFTKFFGERPSARFIVAIGLLDGGLSYGVRVQPDHGSEEMYAVIGAWLFDEEGLPTFDEGVRSTVVHEFNHSFVNPAVSRNERLFRAAKQALEPKVAPLFRGMGYLEWNTMIQESLVRAVVARYLQVKDGPKAASAEVTQQMGLGFVWTDDVVALLTEYDRARDRYPTFELFLPRIADYFGRLPGRLDAKLRRLDALRPKVKSVTPGSGDESVDPRLTEIRVVFDRPMTTGAYSTMAGESGSEHVPAISKSGFDETGTVFTMKVALRPNWTYEIWLNTEASNGFRSREGITLKPYRLRFRTGASGN